MAEKNVNIKITAESKEAEKAISKVTSSINKMGKNSTLKSINSLASAVTNSISAFNTLKTAVEGVISTINDCADAYAKQRSAELALETAAKNNPYLNASNVSSLKKYATELSKLSGIADEDLLPTMTKLAQAGRTESEIMKIMSAATDVAASGVMGFEQACDALNKTYTGQIGSLKELNPRIAQMTADQLKAGDAVEAMAKAYEGTAASMDSITGGTERLRNAMTSLKEVIGESLAEPINNARNALAKLLEQVAEAGKKSRERTSLIKEGRNIAAKAAAGAELTDDETLTKLNGELAQLQANLTSCLRTQTDINVSHKQQLDAIEEEKTIRQQIADKEAEITAEKERQAELARQSAAATPEPEPAATSPAASTEKTPDQIAQEMIDAYKKRIAILKEEIAARRALGDAIDELEEKEMVSEAMFTGLVGLVANSDGYITTNNGFFKSEKAALMGIYEEMLDELTSLAQEKADAINRLLADGIEPDDARIRAGIEELKKLNEKIQELGGEPVIVSVGVSVKGFDPWLEKLEELKAALDAAMPKPDEWRQLSDQFLEFSERLEEMRGNIPDAELEKLEEQLEAVKEALTAPELDGWQKLVKETEDIYTRIAELEVKAKEAANDEKTELEEKYLEEIERLNEVAAKKAADAWDTYVREIKEKLTKVASQISSTISQVASTLSSACELMLETCENRLDATLSKLEIAYLSGEMDEEEYNEAVLKAKKEAAQQEYKIEMWEWSASILTATANIAEGVTKAIAQGGVAGIVTGALVSAAGAVQLASIIASKPTPPTYSTGGIVGGTSYTGDRVQALLNSGEMVLNAGQQRNLFDSINSGNLGTGDSRGQSSSTQIMVNNSAANIVSAEPQVTESQINVMIDMRVNKSMSKGRYNKALTQAEQSQSGKWYGY